MTEAPATPATEVIYGTAKKMSLELEKLPLHSHAAIISLMNTMVQHRKIAIESEMNAAQAKAQEEAMESARFAHAKAQVEREEREAKKARVIVDSATGGLAGSETEQGKPELVTA